MKCARKGKGAEHHNQVLHLNNILRSQVFIKSFNVPKLMVSGIQSAIHIFSKTFLRN